MVIRPFALATLASGLLSISACGGQARPYFVRAAGGYFTPVAKLTPTASVPGELPPTRDAGTAEGRLRKVAETYLGVPYRRGGKSRAGMDCSGFIHTVFSEAYGWDLPRNSADQFRLGKPVKRADLRPGDLVFFQVQGRIDHSGLYMGNCYFIHSATSVGVSYSALDAPYFGDHYAGARRVLQEGGKPGAEAGN